MRKAGHCIANIFKTEIAIEFSVLGWTITCVTGVFKVLAAFRSATHSRIFCPESLLLLALVIRYRDPGQTFAITLHF